MKSNEKDTGLSRIVKNAASVVAIPVTRFGSYIILHGHLTPGGGFAGGAIMATLMVLFLVAFGEKFKNNMTGFSITESLGLILFISLAFLGLSATFFHNFIANSGLFFGMSIPFGSNSGYLGTAGVIAPMNIAVGLEVFSALSVVVIVFYFSGDKDD